MKPKVLRRTLMASSVVAAASLTVAVLYANRGDVTPVVTAVPVTRGDIARTISATGTLEPRKTVEVGTQVSGSIQSLHADFNSIVRKGQVLARLDPALYQSTIEQARANLIRAEADLERMKVTLADARVKRDRAAELSARQLIPATERDAADVNTLSAGAQVRSAEAQVNQARAAVRQAEVNLAKTVITSPIDGIVIARNVDVGQTVAASLSAPTLFVLAAGLDEMQLQANVDEADVGAIQPGQSVTFTVDAYPRDTFAGRVEQVRLNPIVEQNVVTYSAIIGAANPELKLKPGLTANVTVEVSRRDDVLVVPAAALRFRPSDEIRKAFGAPPETPAGPVVWQFVDGRLSPVAVVAGESDGPNTEIVSGLNEGTPVVTRVAAAADGNGTPASRTGASPLMPTGPGPRPR